MEIPSTPVSAMPASRPDRAVSLALGLILAVGAFLRLYHLDVPSMWWDEILVPLTSRFPVSYIVAFSRSEEMHPPFFHLLTKLALLAGDSDFALRLPSAVAGVAGIYLLHRLGARLFSPVAGLFAAAFLAVNPLHVLVSREVRPYALFTVFMILSLGYCVDLVREGRRSSLIGLLASNAALFALHYFTFHIVLAQGVALLGLRLAGVRTIGWKTLFAMAGGTLAVAVPILVVFFLPSEKTLTIFTDFTYTHGELFGLIKRYVAMAVFFFDDPAARWGLAALMILGGAFLLVRDRVVAWVLLTVATLPLLDVLLMKKAAYFSPWHLIYVVPVMGLLAGLGGRLATFRPAGALLAAPALAAGLGLFIFSAHADRYYEETSYHHNVFTTDFAPVARSLAARLGNSDLVAAADVGYLNAVGWYLARFRSPDPFTVQHLSPDQDTALLRCLVPDRTFGRLARDAADFEATYGPFEAVTAIGNTTMYDLGLRREPIRRVTALPYATTLAASLPELYRDAWSLSDATWLPLAPGGVMPTATGRPAEVAWRFENQAPVPVQYITVAMQYHNVGRGNRVELYRRFDDEPEELLWASEGPDGSRIFHATEERARPYATMTLRARLLAAPETPRYPGGNQETAALNRLHVNICDKPEDGFCSEATLFQIVESLQRQHGPERFLTDPIKQTVELPEGQFRSEATEYAGWTHVSPADPERPLIVRARPAKDKGSYVFYPRLSGKEGAIKVFAIGPDGSRREVFLLKGIADLWTPISAQYAVDARKAPAGTTLYEIELTGRWAQLWLREGQVFF